MPDTPPVPQPQGPQQGPGTKEPKGPRPQQPAPPAPRPEQPRPPQAPTPFPPAAPLSQQNTMDRLRREDIRTMHKDTASLRGQETAREQQRIAGMQPQSAPRETPLSQAPRGPELMLPQDIKTAATPASSDSKSFMRILVLGVLALLLVNGAASGYWYFFIRQAAAPAVVNPTDLASPLPPQEQQQSTVVTAPVPAFSPEQSLTVEYIQTSAVQALLAQVLDQNTAGGFTAILLKNTLQNEFANTVQTLQAMGIAMPSQLLALTQQNSTLFLDRTGSKQRLGLVIPLQEGSSESVSSLMRTWEQTMETDTASFFALIGEKGVGYTSLFRSTSYRGAAVRFQTFSLEDIGIVYAVSNGNLVFASSFETAKRVLDRI